LVRQLFTLLSIKKVKMKRIWILGIALSSVFSFIGCSRNAISGRKQAKLINEGQLREMALQEYKTFLSSAKVMTNNTNKDAEMVRRIGTRISNAVTQYYTSQGKAAIFDGYQWEYNLVDAKEVNAWCMPGGKVVVYTGLLPISQNEAALAVVMGHEIAHALLTHGNERISQAMFAQVGQLAGNVALARDTNAVNLFNNLYGIGAQAGVLLPFGRKQELEADRFGLRFAAMAGYNPREAIPLWQRMKAASSGQKPPEWLSTHPAEERRISELTKYMDEALQYYKPMNNVGK
jgi:predicted Zn-dependent protease